MTLVNQAMVFCVNAHGTQKRKYTGEPYWVHPVEVMRFVNESIYGGDERVLAAALLHDTLEDCDVSVDDLLIRFGADVTHMVEMLTDPKKAKNRAERKEIMRSRLGAAPAEVQTIKVADALSNTPSIVKHDKNFGPIYVREIDALLKVLTKADSDLLERANAEIGRLNTRISA